jgi:gas vesicle protein
MGAVLGGVAGYLFFSENGRELRRTLEPHLRDLSAELQASRRTVARAAQAAASAVATEAADHSWATRR